MLVYSNMHKCFLVRMNLEDRELELVKQKLSLGNIILVGMILIISNLY